MNDNDYPVYNVVSFVIYNGESIRSLKKLFRYLSKRKQELTEQAIELKNDINQTENEDFAEALKGQLEVTENLSNMKYYEIFPHGEKKYEFDNNKSAGNGHQVPGVFFTDNEGVQWFRSPNGKLRRKKYLKQAMRAGIVLKHV